MGGGREGSTASFGWNSVMVPFQGEEVEIFHIHIGDIPIQVAIQVRLQGEKKDL